MLQPIYLPEEIEIHEEGDNTARFVIKPYYPGYGPTVGNALRRVLLSSLPGAAITQMKIEDADHEFSTIEGVKEDLVSIMLSLKGVCISSTLDEPIEIRLTASGETSVTAGDFETPPEVTIANPDHHIATLTDSKAKLDIICTVEQGRGYVPSETQDVKERSIGTVALDAVFTPVVRASFSVDNVRVGQATDYHSLELTITTNGTVTPQDALRQAASILRDHFEELAGDFEAKLTDVRPHEEIIDTAPEEPETPENTLNLLQLPSRVHNALERVGITTVEQVMELTDEQIQDIPGLGAKAIHDVTRAREEYKKRMEETEDEK
jgi:DNA-directed RNA polymerase subunit alpha